LDQHDTISIIGLEFYGFHGVSDDEQTIGHRYMVDIRLAVDTRPAALSDQVADTVNYADVVKIVLAINAASRYRLLEALAQRISEELFTRFSRVQALELTVQKRLPPLNGIVQSVGVSIYRTRA
jgi:dihydroneopterin aldolase